MRKKVIIDVDADFDDIAGLSLILKQDIDIIAITINYHGFALEDYSMDAVRMIVEARNKNIPIIFSKEEPLTIPIREFPLEWRKEGRKGTYYALGKSGLDISVLNQKPLEKSVPDVIHSFLKDSKVEIITLGPLTNLARTVIKYQLSNMPNKVTIMGGAISVKGNVGKMPDSEYNFWLDPFAVKTVFKAFNNIRLVPLDITDNFPLNRKVLKKFNFNNSPPDIITETMISFLVKQEEDFGDLVYLWDVVAVAVALMENIKYRDILVDIDDDGKIRLGSNYKIKLPLVDKAQIEEFIFSAYR